MIAAALPGDATYPKNLGWPLCLLRGYTTSRTIPRASVNVAGSEGKGSESRSCTATAVVTGITGIAGNSS